MIDKKFSNVQVQQASLYINLNPILYSNMQVSNSTLHLNNSNLEENHATSVKDDQ